MDDHDIEVQQYEDEIEQLNVELEGTLEQRNAAIARVGATVQEHDELKQQLELRSDAIASDLFGIAAMLSIDAENSDMLTFTDAVTKAIRERDVLRLAMTMIVKRQTDDYLMAHDLPPQYAEEAPLDVVDRILEFALHGSGGEDASQ